MGWVGVSTGKFQGLIDFWRDDLVARVAAGSSLASIQNFLKEEGVRLPVTALRPEATSVGALFCNGSRGWRSGPNQGLRESTLGLCAVDGSGRVLKGGGRVVKNVAGYDLVRLHHGACGAFGVVTDLVVKLQPIPATAAAFAIPAGWEEAKRVLTEARLPRAALEPASQLWLDLTQDHPSGIPAKGALVMEGEGGEQSVRSWAARLPEATFAVDLDAVMASFESEGQWHGTLLSPFATIEAAWPDFAARWRQRGLRVELILDFLSGRAEVFLTGDDFRLLGAATELARESAAHGAILYTFSKKRIVGPAEIPEVRALLERRLKKAFDPEGLLPLPPVELGANK